MGRQLIPTNTKREDCVQTPTELAEMIIQYFEPIGIILEPCKGEGNFLEVMERNIDPDFCDIKWCEILEGKDFFDFKEKVDWIITNPPYSKMRKFMQHSMEISNNVVFLTTINHLWLKARINDIKKAGFGIKEILLCDTPKTFPQTGFQLGIFHLKKDYIGDIKFKLLEDVFLPKQKGGRNSSQP